MSNKENSGDKIVSNLSNKNIAPLYPVNIPRSWFRSLIPLITSLFVFMMVWIMLYSISWNPDELNNAIDALLNNNSNSSISSEELLSRPFAWMSSAFVVTIAFLVVISISLYTIWQTLSDSDIPKRRIIFFIIIILSIGFSFLFYQPWNDNITLVGIFFQKIAKITYRIHTPYFTRIMDTLAWFENFFLLSALCVLCMPLTKNSGSIPNKYLHAISLRNQLIHRKNLATILLYAAAFTLSIAVIQINLLFRLPGNSNQLSNIQLDTIATGLTMFAGAYFSVHLFSIFVPTGLLLKAEAYNLVVASGSVYNTVQLEEMLKNNGLSGFDRQQIVRIVAVLGPVLTGWLGDPIIKAVTSFGGS